MEDQKKPKGKIPEDLKKGKKPEKKKEVKPKTGKVVVGSL